MIGLDENKGLRFDLANARRAKQRGHTTWVDGEPIDEAIASMEKAMAHFQCELAKLSPSSSGARTHAGPITLTPAQAVDWIGELALARADRLIGGTRRIENGHRAMCGVLVLHPICVAAVRDVALAEREARPHGLGALKIVHSTARAIDSLDQAAADRAATPACRSATGTRCVTRSGRTLSCSA